MCLSSKLHEGSIQFYILINVLDHVIGGTDDRLIRNRIRVQHFGVGS